MHAIRGLIYLMFVSLESPFRQDTTVMLEYRHQGLVVEIVVREDLLTEKPKQIQTQPEP